MTMIYMNSLELEKHFLETELPADKTLFVCLSQTLNINLNDSRVIRIQEFLPNAEMLGLFEDARHDAYRTKYVRHLQLAPLTAALGTLINYCIDDEKHVVLLCSVAESQFMYMDVIKDYLEMIFDFKLLSIKEYIKAKKKGKLENYNNYNDETIAKVKSVLADCKRKEPDVDKMVDQIINASYYEAERIIKEEEKIKKKEEKRKKKKKKEKKNDLILSDIELMSSK